MPAPLITLPFELPREEDTAIGSLLAEQGTAFLDSSDGSGESSLRFDPMRVFSIYADGSATDGNHGTSKATIHERGADAIAALQRAIDEQNAITPARGVHGPGWVIFASYDLAHLLDPAMPRPKSGAHGFPLLTAYWYSWSLRRDQRGAWRLEGVDAPGIAIKQRATHLQGLLGAQRSSPGHFHIECPAAKWTRDEYGTAFRQFKEHIAAGDAYIGNLTQRFAAQTTGPTPRNTAALYLALRRAAPASHASYFDCGQGRAILSSSPERFLRVFQESGKRIIETCPIKGTRPVHPDAVADAAARAELLASEKERAELTMIVDLERNDLGRIAKTGTVTVPELCTLKSHGYVHHLHARVRAELRDGVSFTGILRATFPGGSVTGCPKISAMRILNGLEPHARGPYTGSVFALDSAGNMDSNILIRTLLVEPACVSFNTGGGIVTDSQEQAEYDECHAKARGMLAALRGFM